MSSLLLAILFAVSCASASAQTRLLIAAASDLAPLEQPLTAALQKETGLPVVFTFGASGMLARQILSGAPYDLFLSANEKYAKDIVVSKKAEITGTRVFAFGRLGIWSKSGQVKTLEDLTKPAVKKVALPNPATAPYGIAARQALNNSALWPQVRDKVVLGENVRQTLQYAESGNVDAAVVSWTLIFDKGGVLISDKQHVPLRQTAVVLRRTTHAIACQRVLEYLSGPSGQALLKSHGLTPLK